MAEDNITNQIISAAIEVHRELGSGLIEAIYEEFLSMELTDRNISFERQKIIPILYKKQIIKSNFSLDLLVENKVVVELKAVENSLPIHTAQLLTYLKLTEYRIGLLINFNVPVLKNGIQRVVNDY
ncbi:MAG: GxxExxY protein [Methylobacter sp.]|nr:GxxExxY protein [Methylobacter sp.]MDP2100007.1 GxxExxY protein [Methylobacter sp.]MDP2427547.1 GxxExxY protein [Methylobacter sp.]MDP3054523.1 GxxExxY protein [Methylobacter sp.]MDP3362619.1 GxxExxY protein [Methylobacter sp.]